MSDSGTFTVERAYCNVETPGAIRVVDLDTKAVWWVPQAVVHADSEVHGLNHRGKLVVFASFAEKKGMTGRQASKVSQDLPKPTRPVPRGREVALNVGTLVKTPPKRSLVDE